MQDDIRDKARVISREHVIKTLLGLLDTAEHPGWWGEVGIALTVQNGKVETMRKKTEQTEK